VTFLSVIYTKSAYNISGKFTPLQSERQGGVQPPRRNPYRKNGPITRRLLHNQGVGQQVAKYDPKPQLFPELTPFEVFGVDVLGAGAGEPP
jgi:hypothetical protein